MIGWIEEKVKLIIKSNFSDKMLKKLVYAFRISHKKNVVSITKELAKL